MSAARIAARLRERLPEAEGWRVTVSPSGRVQATRSRLHLGIANPHDHRWTAFDHTADPVRNVYALTPVRGRGWPERLADALASALLSAPLDAPALASALLGEGA